MRSVSLAIKLQEIISKQTEFMLSTSSIIPTSAFLYAIVQEVINLSSQLQSGFFLAISNGNRFTQTLVYTVQSFFDTVISGCVTGERR